MHTPGPKHVCVGQLASFVKTNTIFMRNLSQTKTGLRSYCFCITIHVFFIYIYIYVDIKKKVTIKFNG